MVREDGQMDLRILGPLEVYADDGQLALGGRRPRALVAVLALHANEVVAADRLIDDVWGEEVPEGGAAALRLNISRLRKALPADVLMTRAPGYLLRVGPGELDLHRFERLADEGRRLLAAGQAADAATRLRDALAMWRGPALADFAYEDFAQTAVARLEEIRLGALELRIDADLALGRHDELVGELKALVAEHPLREHFRADLMTALYRTGRHAEALDAYQDARRALVDELGIEPSPALQDLERAILRQDRALDLVAGRPARARVDAERSIMVAVGDETHVHALLAVAEPLVRHPPRVLIVARLVPDTAALRSASAWLEDRRSALEARDVTVRTASFTSTEPGQDLARLASELDVDLVLTDAPDELLDEGVPDEQLTALLAGAPCDVAVLVPRDSVSRGPVLVPFGGTDDDWTAVELGAWLARASDSPLRLAGATAAPEQGRRDASRLLSHASLAIQRVLGVAAEPVLTSPGEDGMLEASRDAALLVVGLSTRWNHEGLGPARLGLARHATPPTLFIHHGLRPGGLAPPAALTRFTWSVRR
jgi:DNA-binding SARP family transcriptional activator